MGFVALAALGSAVIGGMASKSASKSQEKATRAGLTQARNLANMSRTTAQNLYGLGMRQGREGLNRAYQFYNQNSARRYQPFIQGNVGAQQAIIQGQQNAQNAILGLPMTQMQAQQITPDTSYLTNPSGLVSGIPQQDLNQMIGRPASSENAAAINNLALKGAGLAGLRLGMRG